MTYSVSLLISNEGVCRTAPATPGLLIKDCHKYLANESSMVVGLEINKIAYLNVGGWRLGTTEISMVFFISVSQP